MRGGLAFACLKEMGPFRYPAGPLIQNRIFQFKSNFNIGTVFKIQ
jgi:hypothetical protein